MQWKYWGIFCRYYVAEGVRIYSQDTWRMVTGGEGKHLVEKFIEHVVSDLSEAYNRFIVYVE